MFQLWQKMAALLSMTTLWVLVTLLITSIVEGGVVSAEKELS